MAEENQKKQQHFYNVMPEASGSGSSRIHTPTVKTTQPAPTQPTKPAATTQPTAITGQPNVPSAPLSVPKSRKPWWILIIIGIFILGIGGALAYFLFFNQESEDQVANDVSTPVVTDPLPNPEVTTDPAWLERYFGNSVCTEINICGDKSDPDRDGLTNQEEFEKGTGPNDADSDSDGIADGDEIKIFETDPLISRTYRAGEYADPDFIKGGYDIKTDQPYTPERKVEIQTRIKQFGLHQPTISTLGTVAFELYDYVDPDLPPLPADLDLSPEAKLNRDSQRQDTIKKVGQALLAYKEDKGSYPPVEGFVLMSDMIKPYNTTATNYNDPISREPYVYGYQALDNNNSFFLTYYSETQNQLIKYDEQDALEDKEEQNTVQLDNQRKADVEAIANALMVYSSTQLDPDSELVFVFPPKETYKQELEGQYITKLPVDPVTGLDYVYEVGDNFSTFQVRTPLDNPVAGTTGYRCTQVGCEPY